jgi:hypothetical protein
MIVTLGKLVLQELDWTVIVHLLVKLGYIKGNNRTCERR